jgi:hypothetical protein
MASVLKADSPTKENTLELDNFNYDDEIISDMEDMTKSDDISYSK